MGDWTDKDQFLADIDDAYGDAWEQRNRAQSEWNAADDTWSFGSGWYHTYCRQMLDSIEHLISAVDYLTITNYAYYPSYGVVYGFKYHTGEGEPLTWRTICETLAKDDFEGRYWFIAIIDHMRTLIWDKPFNIVWATKPEKE